MKRSLLYLGCAMIATIALYSIFYPEEPVVDSTWIWDPIAFYEQREDYFNFLEQKSISKIYVQIEQEMKKENYYELLERAHRNNITVYALDGAPDWVINENKVAASLNWLRSYQAEADLYQRFDGFNIDVEPYLLPQWEKEQGVLLKGYKNVLKKVASFTEAEQISLDWTIPFWLHQLSLQNGQPLLPVVEQEVDQLVIMAYRTELEGPNGLYAIIAPYAEERENTTPFTLVFETEDVFEEVEISFYNQSERKLNTFIVSARETYEDHPRFRGVSIHHLPTWIKVATSN